MTALAPAPLLRAADGTAAVQGQERVARIVRADVRSGHLVRSVVVAPAETGPRDMGTAKKSASARLGFDAKRISSLVDETANRHGVDPQLVHSVIRVESNYNPAAVSPKGAEGLMQLIPTTARRFGATNSFNVEDNLEAGVKYLKYLLELFGDERLAVAAYNAGESAVQRYGNVPPYRETIDYVSRVGKAMGTAKRPAARTAPAVVPAAPAEAAPETRPVEAFLDAEGRICLRTR